MEFNIYFQFWQFDNVIFASYGWHLWWKGRKNMQYLVYDLTNEVGPREK